MASKVELETALQSYEDALALKSNKLPNLDDWFHKELRLKVQSRRSTKDGAYITTDELVKLMKWKLTRGKFRPKLEQLAGSNSEELVKNVTQEAFAMLTDSTSIDSAKKSLQKLNILKGIGPATASAILSLFSPDSLPFMSDEALKFAAGLSDKPKYNIKEWEWFVVEMRDRTKKEGWSGTDQLEKAAWSLGILKTSKDKGKSDVSKKRMMDEKPQDKPASVKRQKKNV